jgi:hypothetical protein
MKHPQDSLPFDITCDQYQSVSGDYYYGNGDIPPLSPTYLGFNYSHCPSASNTSPLIHQLTNDEFQNFSKKSDLLHIPTNSFSLSESDNDSSFNSLLPSSTFQKHSPSKTISTNFNSEFSTTPPRAKTVELKISEIEDSTISFPSVSKTPSMSPHNSQRLYSHTLYTNSLETLKPSLDDVKIIRSNSMVLDLVKTNSESPYETDRDENNCRLENLKKSFSEDPSITTGFETLPSHNFSEIILDKDKDANDIKKQTYSNPMDSELLIDNDVISHDDKNLSPLPPSFTHNHFKSFLNANLDIPFVYGFYQKFYLFIFIRAKN